MPKPSLYALKRWLTTQKRPIAWQRASKQCKIDHPRCECCGLTHDLEAHDVLPYHLWPTPESVTYDEWYANMITLCRVKGWGCHILHAHCGDSNGLLYNPRIRELAAAIVMYPAYCRS